MHQVTAVSCRFWRKCNFACKRPKSKMKMLIVRCTRNQMSWNLHHRTRESFPVPTMMICAIPTFDVNHCSLRAQTFCFYLLRLGFAVTGAPAEHFGTRIHGGDCNNQLGQSPEAGWRKGRQSGGRVPEREAEWQEGARKGGRVAGGCQKGSQCGRRVPEREAEWQEGARKGGRVAGGCQKGRQSGRRVPEREAEWQEGAGNGGRVAEGCRKERLGVCRTPALINNNTGVNSTGCTKQEIRRKRYFV